MGWPYISGASLANTVFTLAAQEGLLKAPVQRIEEESPLFLTGDGRAIDAGSARKAIDIFNELYENAADNEPGNSSCLSSYIDCGLKAQLENFPKHERWDIARAAYGLMRSLRSQFGESLEQVYHLRLLTVLITCSCLSSAI